MGWGGEPGEMTPPSCLPYKTPPSLADGILTLAWAVSAVGRFTFFSLFISPSLPFFLLLFCNKAAQRG